MLYKKYLHMKLSLWTNHGALNSKPVFDAFARGAESLGYDVVWNDPVSDVDVIWSVLWHGRMAKNKTIWDRNILQSKPTLVLEVGGIRRGTTWKVGLNGINRDAYFGPMGHDNSRAALLNLELKPWNTSGTYILLCGQHERSEQWKGMPSMSKWVSNTIETIQKYTDRPIVFRPHPRCPLPDIEHEFKNVTRQVPCQTPGSYDDFDIDYSRVWATVSWSSNPGIHSILNGVPAFVGPSSLAFDVANYELANIENPLRPDRQQWLNDYAWTEFTVEEISQGIPLKHLTNKLF
jgi:hypothetical protein